MKLWLDDILPAPDGWKASPTLAEAMLHLSTGLVTEATLRAATPWAREIVDWMIRTGVWPIVLRTDLEISPRADGPQPHVTDEMLIVAERVAAYCRSRTDLENAPRFTCWTAPGDDADEVMGFWTPAKAAGAFALGRWRLAGCPDKQIVHVIDQSSGAKRLFECWRASVEVKEVTEP